MFVDFSGHRSQFKKVMLAVDHHTTCTDKNMEHTNNKSASKGTRKNKVNPTRKNTRGLVDEDEQQLLEDVESYCGLHNLKRKGTYTLAKLFDSKPDVYPASAKDRKPYQNRVDRLKKLSKREPNSYFVLLGHRGIASHPSHSEHNTTPSAVHSPSPQKKKPSPKQQRSQPNSPSSISIISNMSDSSSDDEATFTRRRSSTPAKRKPTSAKKKPDPEASNTYQIQPKIENGVVLNEEYIDGKPSCCVFCLLFLSVYVQLFGSLAFFLNYVSTEVIKFSKEDVAALLCGAVYISISGIIFSGYHDLKVKKGASNATKAHGLCVNVLTAMKSIDSLWAKDKQSGVKTETEQIAKNSILMTVPSADYDAVHNTKVFIEVAKDRKKKARDPNCKTVRQFTKPYLGGNRVRTTNMKTNKRILAKKVLVVYGDTVLNNKVFSSEAGGTVDFDFANNKELRKSVLLWSIAVKDNPDRLIDEEREEIEEDMGTQINNDLSGVMSGMHLSDNHSSEESDSSSSDESDSSSDEESDSSSDESDSDCE